MELRLCMKMLKRKAKNADMSERDFQLKAKNYYKVGNIEMAKIHATSAIQCRYVSVHYQKLLAQITPYEFQLKGQFRGELSPETEIIIRDICRLRNNEFENFKPEEVSPCHVDTYLLQLNDEVAMDLLKLLPNIDQKQFDIEEKLASLRRP